MKKNYVGDMSDSGLPSLDFLLSDLEPVALPQVGKVAIGGMCTNFPTGLELDEPRRGFSLLKSSGDDFDHPATHNFRRGDQLRHKTSGVHCRFVRDADGLAEVDYDGEIARHAYGELAADGRKAIAAAALAKSGGFRVGDEVCVLDGSRGKIVKLHHGAAEVKTRTGSVIARIQDLRAAGGLRKNMPKPGTEVVLQRNGRDVGATVLYCQADRIIVRFADGSQAAVSPEECTIIAEGQVEEPTSLLEPSGDYRLVPKGAGNFSLLKGVKPFSQVSISSTGGSGDMSDTGL